MSKRSWNALAAWLTVMTAATGVAATNGPNLIGWNGIFVLTLAASFAWAWSASDY